MVQLRDCNGVYQLIPLDYIYNVEFVEDVNSEEDDDEDITD